MTCRLTCNKRCARCPKSTGKICAFNIERLHWQHLITATKSVRKNWLKRRKKKPVTTRNTPSPLSTRQADQMVTLSCHNH